MTRSLSGARSTLAARAPGPLPSLTCCQRSPPLVRKSASERYAKRLGMQTVFAYPLPVGTSWCGLPGRASCCPHSQARGGTLSPPLLHCAAPLLWVNGELEVARERYALPPFDPHLYSLKQHSEHEIAPPNYPGPFWLLPLPSFKHERTCDRAQVYYSTSDNPPPHELQFPCGRGSHVLSSSTDLS